VPAARSTWDRLARLRAWRSKAPAVAGSMLSVQRIVDNRDDYIELHDFAPSALR
jgi:hypothetical protein